MFIRRLGNPDRQTCEYGHNCPQILEMTDRSLAVVGEDIRSAATESLPAGLGIGDSETIVKIPRRVMLEAAIDLLRNA